MLILSGVVQSIIEVGSFPALLDTAFGRSVLIKIVVALAIVAIGFVNRQKLVPALKRAAAGHTSPGRAGVLIRRTLRFELVLGLTALAATGALSSYAPSVAESAGPFSTNVNIGPARLEATVDPAKVGPNEMHFYLFDRKTGAPFEGTEELRVTRRDAGEEDRADRALPVRRRPRPLRRRRGHDVRQGRLDDLRRRPRLRLRRVRGQVHRPDRMT